MTNTTTNSTARKPTQRAFELWRTIDAARSGVRASWWADGGAENRSTGAGVLSGRVAGSRSSGPGPDGSLMHLLEGGDRPRSQTTGRRRWRDQAGLAERDGRRPEGDLEGVDRHRAAAVDDHREAVHAPGRRAVLGAEGLDPQPVVARAMAGAFEPEVLEARVRLAAQVGTALVERPDVDVRSVTGRVRAGHELLARGVDQDHVGLGRAVVRGEALIDGQARVLGLDVGVGPHHPAGPGRAARRRFDAVPA